MSGKYTNMAQLRKRGWTPELVRELLPKPRYFMQGGHPKKVWDKEDVREAEANPRFASRGTRSGAVNAKAPTPGTRKACAMLTQAWEGEKEDA